MDVLDPRKLANHLGIKLFSPYDIPGLTYNVINQLLVHDTESWSAGCIMLPNMQFAIIYNPIHADTRIRASLMEELAHIYLKHEATSLITFGDSISLRSTYHKKQEDEAYWVGAAALLPLSVLKYAHHDNISRNDLAVTYSVSISLVRFRENITHIKLAD